MVAAIKRGEGEVALFVAPSGGVTINVPLVIGRQLVVPLETKAQTLTFEGAITGVWEVDCDAADAYAVGDGGLIWDISTATIQPASFTPAAGDLTGAGVAMEAKAGGSGTRVKIALNKFAGTIT
jgi:hypothetical protein